MSNWIPPIINPFQFTLTEGLKSVLDGLRSIRDGLLGIRNEILENRRHILDAIRKLAIESGGGLSQDDLTKINNQVEKLVKEKHKNIIDEINRCKCAKEASKEIKDKIDEIKRKIEELPNKIPGPAPLPAPTHSADPIIDYPDLDPSYGVWSFETLHPEVA